MRLSDLERARATASSHLTRANTRQFDIALHSAAVTSLDSMDDLHRAVCECVTALKHAEVGAVDMILAIKSCAQDSADRYKSESDELPASSVNGLMDQIVKWAIAKYYAPPALGDALTPSGRVNE